MYPSSSFIMRESLIHDPNPSDQHDPYSKYYCISDCAPPLRRISRAPLPRVKQGPTPYYSKCCDVEQREGELKSPWLYKFSDFTLRAAAQVDI
jgi:hypothetical protein